MGYKSASRSSLPCEASKNTFERLSCIAAYYGGCTSPFLSSDQKCESASISVTPQFKRLPLAWLAVSPSARIIAERMEAERLVSFRFSHDSTGIAAGKSDKINNDANEEEDPFPLMFATSTTTLSTTQEAILDASNDFNKGSEKQDPPRCAPLINQINPSMFRRVHLSDAYNSVDDRKLYEKRSSWGKIRCGTQIAGLVTVLISARDLLEKSLANHRACLSVNDAASTQQEKCSLPTPFLSKGGFNDVWISHEIPGTPLREKLCSDLDFATGNKEMEKATDEKSLKSIFAPLQGSAYAVRQNESDPVGLLSSLPCEEKYLFPITALPAEVMSIPEMVNFSHPISTGQNEKEYGQGTVVPRIPAADDQRENLKSAASTLNASRLAHWAAHLPPGHSSKSSFTAKCDDVCENHDVLYRVVLVTRPDAVKSVMLGVSQWWLQRPIHPHELGYDYLSEEYPQPARNGGSGRAKDGVLVPIQLKFASLSAASVFYVPLKVSLLCRFMVFVCYVHACLAFCFTLCDNATASAWLPSAKIAEWCGLTDIQLDHSNDEAFKNKLFGSADEKLAAPRTFLASLLFILSIIVAIPLLMLTVFITLLLRFLSHSAEYLCLDQRSTFIGMFSSLKRIILSFMPSEEIMRTHGWLQNRLRERASAMETCHWLYRLGVVYADQLQALDISHTGIGGTHMLAFALGIHTATHNDVSATPKRASALRALDASGCLFLDLPRDASLFQTELDVRRYLGIPCSTTEKNLNSDATTVDEILAYSENLKMLSHAGRALARLCLCTQSIGTGKKYGLQLINVSGSSLDSEVLDELGQCALLYELEAAHRHNVSIKMSAATSETDMGGPSSESLPTSPVVSPLSSLIAINLTSCRRVRSVNALSYITSLVQILAPFTDINNAGVVHLDGSAFHQVLGRVADLVCRSNHLCCTRSGTMHTINSNTDAESGASDGTVLPPSCTTTSFMSLLNCFLDTDADGKNEFVRGFPEINSFLEFRFQSHLYHLDVTFCLGVESLASLCRRQWLLHYLNVSHTNARTIGLSEIASLEQSSPGHTSPHRPLRVLVAEYCNILNDLDGLQLFPNLRKLYVRNGSLDASGLDVFSSHAESFNNLIFLDLSYCEKVEDVSMLASLPSLQTLILDNTEILCDGIKGLDKCPVLKTLSVRFCPDFAPVGPSKERLDQMVVNIPTLQNYIYENLACDEMPFEQAEDIKKTEN